MTVSPPIKEDMFPEVGSMTKGWVKFFNAIEGINDTNSLISGTAFQVIVNDNGDYTVTLSLPQNIDTNADVEFDSLVLEDLTASRLIGSNNNKKLVSITNLASWIAGTSNQITVTDDGDGSVTLSLPQVGGHAIKLTNKTGSNTVAGQIVEASTTTDSAFGAIAASDTHPIGVVLDAGIADGSEAWVVVSGIADVLIDSGGCTHGDRLITSATAGSALVNNTPTTAQYLQVVGHSIKSRTGAGLALAVLNFL